MTPILLAYRDVLASSVLLTIVFFVVEQLGPAEPFQAPMLLLFGTFAPHIVATVLMFRLWGFVNHANVRIGFGPLTSLIAGPQWHRIHHSILPEHRDMNFAALFPFIDRLFHTYYKPGRDEYPRTGLPSNGETSLRQATISPLIGWYDAVRRVMRRSRAGAGDPPNSQPAL